MKKYTVLVLLLISQGLLNAQAYQAPKMPDTKNSIQQNQGSIMFDKLLRAFNQSADDVVSLFHQEATIEFPYAASLGTASKLNWNEYRNYLKGGLPNMPDINFGNIKVYEISKNRYWAEVHGSAQIPSTGKLYQQDYVMYFTLKEGKINFYKEYWDPIAALKAFGNKTTLEETFNTKN